MSKDNENLTKLHTREITLSVALYQEISKLFPTFWSLMRGSDILDGLQNKKSIIDLSYLPKVVMFSGEDKDAYKFIEVY